MTSASNRPTFSITTPLYYVNDVPHIGSAYTTIAADVVSRYHRLQGHPTLFVTGTDEHGQKIQRTATEKGRSPQEHCDLIVQGFQSLWQMLNIQYDRFIRTTDPRHTTVVQQFFQRCWDNGDIYLGQQKGWYCVACEEYKEERDLLKDHYCAIHTNRQAEWRDESNYFFRLSSYQERLEALYEEHPDYIQPEIRRNEVLSFVQQGLKDFSISRVNMDWGIPLPTDPDHTLYVWFDALLGYVTALLDDNDDASLDNALKTWWPIHTNLIGKDILRFHAVYWPAMLMSAGLPVTKRVFGHGFLTKDGQKMGKSLGNTIDPVDLVKRYGSDAVRYYFMKEIEFGRDGDFNEERFVNILNADLANDLGNLLNRTMKLLHKYCEGKAPTVEVDAIATDHPLKSQGLDLAKTVIPAYEALAFSTACDPILTLVRTGNKYMDDKAPWSLFKQQKEEEAMLVLYSVLETVRLAAYWLSPIVPILSTRIYQQLGYDIDFDGDPNQFARLSQHGNWGTLEPGRSLSTPDPVFRRLELPA